jgi:DNA polymerase-4
MSEGQSCYWPRAILHLDMNAFFAAVESRDFPELRGKPIGVTNGEVGTTLITCSYEARAFGVKTGMRVYEARKLCPGLIQRPARPQVYAALSTRIMRALHDLSPDVEVFSVDEAFIDVTHCQRLHGTPEHMAGMARELVRRASDGLPCSIGVAGTKLIAKVASELKKPDGLTIIPPWEARERLAGVPMEKLCGIGPHIAEFLRMHGARTLGDVAALPLTILERRYGVTGKHLWLAAQGRDPDPVVTEVAPPKSVGHGKVLPPRTTSRRVIETYLRHMCEKVAARLRRYQLQAGRLYVGLRYVDSSADAVFGLPYGPAEGRRLFECTRALLKDQWRGEAVTQVQVTATHLRSASGQLDLFTEAASATEHATGRTSEASGDSSTSRGPRLDPIGVSMLEEQRAQTMDRINNKYGEFTLAPATLLERSTMPNVIAPAWRPDGHRQTIPD